MIRIDALWLCTAPMDMRAGAERLLSCVVQTTGAAQAHHGYLFANVRATRIKLLVHDGFGVWCAAAPERWSLRVAARGPVAFLGAAQGPPGSSTQDQPAWQGTLVCDQYAGYDSVLDKRVYPQRSADTELLVLIPCAMKSRRPRARAV